jgi:drug/metabolite transporter (DMT)-like permease
VDPLLLMAGLGSALLHAVWNAAARARPDPGQGLAMVVYAAGIIAIPVLALTGLPARESWPWLLAGLAFNTVSLRLLMAAYRSAPFSVAYPIARGFAPLLVTAAAFLIAAEQPSPLALGGIAGISCGLVLLAARTLHTGTTPAIGVGIALASSAFAAGYITMDAIAVRLSGGVVAYGLAVALLNAITLGVWNALEGHPPWRIAARDWGFGLLACIASFSSYMLILYAFAHGPTGPVSALRETSVLFATAIAAWLLKERVGPYEWLSAAMVVAGIAMIRFG